MPKIRVLLIDDNQDLIDVLAEGLTNQGEFDVFTALDGFAGLMASVESQPDCIVIDVKMPQLDGYQVVRALRGDPATANIPLLILTALPQDRERFTGLASGVDTFLRKPLTPLELAREVRATVLITPEERLRRLVSFAQQQDLPKGGRS